MTYNERLQRRPGDCPAFFVPSGSERSGRRSYLERKTPRPIDRESTEGRMVAWRRCMVIRPDPPAGPEKRRSPTHRPGHSPGRWAARARCRLEGRSFRSFLFDGGRPGAPAGAPIDMAGPASDGRQARQAARRDRWTGGGTVGADARMPDPPEPQKR